MFWFNVKLVCWFLSIAMIGLSFEAEIAIPYMIISMIIFALFD